MDRRLGNVLRRSHPGDIAVIDYLDLDRGSAEALLEHRVAAVVNAAPFISGPLPEPRAGAPRPGRRRARRRGRARRSSARLKDGAAGPASTRTPCTSAREPVASGRRLHLEDVAGADGRRPRGAHHPAAEPHRTTPPSSSGASRTCCCTARACPSCAPRWPAARSWSWSATSSTRTTSSGCAASSGSSTRCWSGVDAGADALLAAGLRPDLLVIGEGGFARPGGVRGPGGVRQGAHQGPRGAAARRLLRPARRRRPARPARGARRTGSPRAAPPRTSRCWSPTSRAPRSSSRSAPTPPSTSSSTGTAAGWPRPSSPGSGSGRGWSTRGASRRCTPAGCGSGSSPSCCWPGSSPSARRWPPRRRGSSGLTELVDASSSSSSTRSEDSSRDHFRYHVVSLVAVLLALAVGIALGGGPLQRTPDDDVRPAATRRRWRPPQAELAQLEESTAFADDYADETAGARARQRASRTARSRC